MLKILLHIIFILLAGVSFAQTGSLVSNVNKIEIGDQVEISLRFTFGANINPQEVIYPEIKADESINENVDIISTQDPKIESTTDNQGNQLFIWQQNFVVGIYAGGKVEIGPFSAIHNTDTITSNVTTIQVDAPELQEETGFVGIKDISTDPFTFWERIWLSDFSCLIHHRRFSDHSDLFDQETN